jgi:DNA-binding SARP family transcriptional activator/tetratricopeptide (TPR) repeat protein
MRFAILGPLGVTDGDRDVAVTAGRDRVVLAVLLLQAGRIVGVGELIDAVWGDDPPATARGQLQTCVSRLRRTLPAGLILTDPAGYGISPASGDLDATVFAGLTAAARTAADPDEAGRLLRRALDLWRGAALAGIESTAVRHAAAALDEQRLVATEDWYDLELAAGRGRALIGELAEHVERYPLRERLRAQLMRSLSAAGRQGDALAEYRRARQVLRDELGIEPGTELQQVQQRLLAGDPPPAAAPAGTRIRCLPRTVADFTGRADVVGRLLATVERGDPAGPVVAVIDGMAGSGKTTLALHVANLVADRYPDAHLFVDLHGHSELEPVEPSAALLTLLRQLGVPAEKVPGEPADRINLWRGELSTRRVLVVFDNAASSAQLADLLPTSAGSLALVTSRRRLAGLDGVHPESLAVLDEPEGVALLARIAGDRVGAEPEAAAEVVRRCGRLPLALRLAGSRLAHRPRWRVADLVRRLGGSALPELSAEDRTVVSAFALSYGQLAERTQRVFRLLGLHPGPDFDVIGAAALSGLASDEAEDVIDDLVDVHLVDEPEPGVFRLHDLLKQYAATMAADMSPAERQAAVVQVLDLQVHAMLRTVVPAHLGPTVRDLRLGEPLRPDLVAAVSDPAERLERERPSLGAYQDAAIEAGRPEYAWQLARAAWRHLWSRGYTADIETTQLRALRTAEALGDRSAIATAANYLASAYFRWARYEQARVLSERSIQLRRELGEEAALATAMGNLSAIYEAMCLTIESLHVSEEALKISRRVHDTLETELRLNAVAVAYGVLGRYAEALHYQRLRLMIVAEIDDAVGIGNSVLHIVFLKRRAGLAGPATAHRGIRVALAQFRLVRYSFGESDARDELADLLRSEGRYAEALVEHHRALEIIVRLGDRRFEAAFGNGLARTLLETGDPAGARAANERALQLARGIPQPFEEARALLGLGDSWAAADPVRARDLWAQAHERFVRLQVPERYDTARRLGGVDQLHAASGGGTMEA